MRVALLPLTTSATRIALCHMDKFKVVSASHDVPFRADNPMEKRENGRPQINPGAKPRCLSIAEILGYWIRVDA